MAPIKSYFSPPSPFTELTGESFNFAWVLMTSYNVGLALKYTGLGNECIMVT